MLLDASKKLPDRWDYEIEWLYIKGFQLFQVDEGRKRDYKVLWHSLIIHLRVTSLDMANYHFYAPSTSIRKIEIDHADKTL